MQVLSVIDYSSKSVLISKVSDSMSTGTGTSPWYLRIFTTSGILIADIRTSLPLGKFLAWRYKSRAVRTLIVTKASLCLLNSDLS
mmetsp:Transcript_19984/g.3262  ORF Transcript_19984/g.3262 Transcript_19984/m.3262 type:complete len:85 (-) Transcript_19984:116-370(-)